MIYRIDDIPEESKRGSGVSDNVLIDVDGDRKTFLIGWYDHYNKKWVPQVVDELVQIKSSMRWQWLSLIKYEKKRPKVLEKTNA